jgi:class 3 adenylate cyclase
VNLSHALTKVAPRGGLLATEPAAAMLPGSMITDRVNVDVAGIDGPVPAVGVVASPVPRGGDGDPGYQLSSCS